MPIWKIACVKCGYNESALVTLRQREEAGGHIPCGRCGAMNDARPTAAQVLSSERTVRVAGMAFDSAKAADGYAEKHGLVPVDKGTDAYKDLRHKAAQAADDLAKRHGYRDAEDRRSRGATEKAMREQNLSVAAQQVDAAVKQLGSEAKTTPEKALKQIQGGT